MSGLTDQGELLVVGSRNGMAADTLAVYDSGTGAISTVVAWPAPRSPDTVASQIDGPTGNARWIIWEETGFVLEHDDWTMWAADRRTGRVRKIASFDPGPDGQAAPGWTSDVALLGDVAAWSAPAMLGPGRAGQRLYVADLAAQRVRRLDAEARWPWLLSRGELEAVVQTGTDASSGKVLAQPATFDLATGASKSDDWIPAARLVSAAGSGAGVVVERLLTEATADRSYATADAVVRDASGKVRTFVMPGQFGSAAAGAGFLAWTDSLHAWLLPSGAWEPQVLVSVEGDPTAAEGRVQVMGNGPWVFWRGVGFDYDWSAIHLASVSCP